MLVTRRVSEKVIRVSTATPLRGAQRPYATRGQEPAVEEVLADPIVRAVMARDHVEESELRAFIAKARRTLAEGGGRRR